jgi:membrane-associated phospholipid phosphatase
MNKMPRCALGVLLAFSLKAQVEPSAGQWKTWVIASGNAFRLPTPPDSGITASELQQVKDMAAQRDRAAVDRIRYWDAGSPGYRWMQLAQQYAVAKNLPAAMTTRALALTAVAINDATIAAWDSKYVYNRKHPSEVDATVETAVAVPLSPSYPSEHAAAAQAAAEVLAYVFPDLADTVYAMAEEAAQTRVAAGVAFPSDASAGLKLGEMVGEAVVDYAKSDGSDQVFTGSYPPLPGVWSNPAPQTPLAGTWRPWALTSGQDFRPPAPPAADSPEAKAQYDAVKNLTRTNTTNHAAWFWQPGFFQPWLQAVESKIFEAHLDANAPRAALIYALETIAQHDATIACWDSKYTYLELRPSQADATITTLFANPPHPGYPSGHACASGASAAVLSALFPAEAPRFADMAREAGLSTFYAGIHTQLDVEAGLALGTAAGQRVIEASGVK